MSRLGPIGLTQLLTDIKTWLASKGLVATAKQVRDDPAAGSTANLVYSKMATNDFFRIQTGGAANAGYAEIATGDDYNEPIYIRQYQGEFATLKRTATILDGNGNTSFPGEVTATSFNGKVVSDISGSYVQGVTANGAIVTQNTTSFGTVWNAPTKSYRVGCGTFPSTNELVYLAYSVTNDNVTAGTNTVAKQLTWDASNGTLTANAFSGNASSATQFSANTTVALTGDATGTSAGSKKGWSVPVTLANSGVTAGTYGPSADVTGNNNATISVPEITVDAKGRVTSVTNRTLTCKNNTYNVYNKTLTIQKNGTNVATFTSNSNTDVTANITVPTKTSELTNDSGFLTSHQSLSNYVTLNGTQTITGAKTFQANGSIINVKSTGQEKGVKPSSNLHNFINFVDKNGTQMGYISRYQDKNGYSCIQINASNLFKDQALATDGSNTGVTLTIGLSTKGVAYWQAPMGSWESIYPHSERVSTITLGTATNKWNQVFAGEYHAYSANAFMANYNGYTFLIRNDGGATYFLMSAQNGDEGTWTTARPLTIDNATGVCSINGNAATATQFSANKSVTLTGDVTGTASSKAGWSVTTTLANSGVTAGSYGPSAAASPAHGGTFSVPYVTVDAKGRVTAASTITITLPADSNTDTKVTQTVTTGNSNYPIILGNTASQTATETSGARFTAGAYINTRYATLRLANVYNSDALKGTRPTSTRQNLSIQGYTKDDALISQLRAEMNKAGLNRTFIETTNWIKDGAVATDGTATTCGLYIDVLDNGIKQISTTGLWASDLTPVLNNSKSLGTTDLRWKECYANAYFLGTTAFGDIVTHNASEFLTSHQSLSNYVTLNGAQTISGAKTFTGDVIGISKDNSTENANDLYSTTAGSKLTYYTTTNGGTKLTNVPAAVNTTLESRTIRKLSDSDWIVEQICHNSNGLYYRKGSNGTWDAWKTFAFTDSNISGTAANVTGTVAIANGGTGATTRLGAVKNLTSENVGTGTQYFLTITQNWGKAGYCSVADAKTVLSVPTKTSQLTNDSGYLTSHQDLSLYPYKVSAYSSYGNGRWPYRDLGDTTTYPNGFNEIVTTGKYQVRFTSSTPNSPYTVTSTANDGILEIEGISSAGNVSSYQRIVQRFYKFNSAHIVYFRAASYHDGQWNWSSSWTVYGDIVTHNASEFLTSHQSLSNYVTLNGTQTISGAKTFSAIQYFNEYKLVVKATNQTVGTTPRSNKWNGMVFQDTAGTNTFTIENGHIKNGSTQLNFSCTPNISGAAKETFLQYYCGTTEGASVLNILTATACAPTPAAGDNSTKIATTAFVRSGYVQINTSGYAIGDICLCKFFLKDIGNNLNNGYYSIARGKTGIAGSSLLEVTFECSSANDHPIYKTSGSALSGTWVYLGITMSNISSIAATYYPFIALFKRSA